MLSLMTCIFVLGTSLTSFKRHQENKHKLSRNIGSTFKEMVDEARRQDTCVSVSRERSLSVYREVGPHRDLLGIAVWLVC